MTLGLNLWQLVVQEYIATALNDVSAYVTSPSSPGTEGIPQSTTERKQFIFTTCTLCCQKVLYYNYNYCTKFYKVSISVSPIAGSISVQSVRLFLVQTRLKVNCKRRERKGKYDQLMNYYIYIVSQKYKHDIDISEL